MNLIVGDCERLGCPDLPEDCIPVSKRRESFHNTPSCFVAGTAAASPDDVNNEDLPQTDAEWQQVCDQLFPEGERDFGGHNGVVPMLPCGPLERQDAENMGIRSQNCKKNTRQTRERHATLVRANKANAAKRLFNMKQSKLFTKEIGFNRFRDCNICVRCVLKKKHEKQHEVTIPKRPHHELDHQHDSCSTTVIFACKFHGSNS